MTVEIFLIVIFGAAAIGVFIEVIAKRTGLSSAERTILLVTASVVYSTLILFSIWGGRSC